MTIASILLVVSLILFLLAAFNVPAGPVSLGWAGAAFFVLAQLVPGLR